MCAPRLFPADLNSIALFQARDMTAPPTPETQPPAAAARSSLAKPVSSLLGEGAPRWQGKTIGGREEEKEGPGAGRGEVVRPLQGFREELVCSSVHSIGILAQIQKAV